MLKYLVSLVNLIKCFLLTVYLMVYLTVHLCGYLWCHHLTVYLRTLFQAPKRGIRPFCGQCPIMVHLCGYLWCYFLLGYEIYISKTYFKKFSYNKDIKMDIL